ncbi:MAG: family 43 glycosylhydrolase [Flavobacteriales bacterium]|nr:family 43 glycosylhydrolase [Flavobacteriales bacterium]
MKKLSILLLLLSSQLIGFSQNPIIPNKGANDPHIRIIDGKAYLSASHDKEQENTKFIMDDWWLWESDNLVDWKLVTMLTPEETYIGKPFTRCWATDFTKRNGKYYWYFSEGNKQTGVVVADNPAGPWKDPLGKPLLTEEMTPTDEYDMGIIEDDKGDFYIVFGVWNFHIAKLNEDMISLAEDPKEIIINNQHGPYNQDGKATEWKTDDKPFMHMYNGKYYLSWGCFYAMSDNLYGPYDYKGSIMEKSSFAKGYDKPTWPNGFKQGRHGSFFEWHNQWYFSYCDISQTGNRFFRDTFISYVHYKANGEMALIRVDGIGVGNYDANQGAINAADYFKSSGTSKIENKKGDFSVTNFKNGDYLTFQKVKGLEDKSQIRFNVTTVLNEVSMEVRLNNPDGKLLGTYNLNGKMKKFDFPSQKSPVDLCFVFKGIGESLLVLDSFEFK